MSYNRWAPAPIASRASGILAPTYSTELYHHGVKGMKWGVRREQNSYNRRLKRDLSMLNANDYQRVRRGLKDKYEKGAINKDEYKAGKKEANASYKQSEKRIKHLKAGQGTVAAFAKTRAKAMSEIPNYKLKRGLRTANTLLNVLAGVGLAASAGSVAAGAAMMGAAYGSAYGVSAGSAAVAGTLAGGTVGLGIQGGLRAGDAAIRRKLLQTYG